MYGTVNIKGKATSTFLSKESKNELRIGYETIPVRVVVSEPYRIEVAPREVDPSFKQLDEFARSISDAITQYNQETDYVSPHSVALEIPYP